MTDLPTLLQLADLLPRDDRIRLVQEVWDRLGDDQDDDMSAEERVIIERRVAELHANPGMAIQWDEILAHVRRPE